MGKFCYRARFSVNHILSQGIKGSKEDIYPISKLQYLRLIREKEFYLKRVQRDNINWED